MSVRRQLEAALGVDAVEDLAPSLAIDSRDRESARRAVEILVDSRTPFSPVGSGRRAASRLVTIAAPRGVFDLWPGELVARVGAGTTLASVESALSAQKLSLGIDAPRFGEASVGGVLAAADRGVYGAVGRDLRDRVLGGTWVDGTATLRKAGTRVVKNVAGYDLTRLHHGARGSLGLLLDLTVRLQAAEPPPRVLWIPAERQTPRTILEWWRSNGPSDTLAEIWIDGAAARELDLDERAGLMVARHGAIECVRGRTIEHECLRAARDLGWIRPSWLLRWMAPSSCIDALDEQSTEGFLRVHDLLSGQSWISGPGSIDPRRVNGLIAQLELISTRGSVWLELSPEGFRPTGGGDPVLLRAHARLKQVFDPYGLLPAAPRPLRGELDA